MSSGGFCLLWGKTLESSLWVRESKETRLLWLTMLMMKDSEGVVKASVVGLADRAKITVGECRESLKVLMSPDPEDTSKVAEGRRILEVPGGWQVINHDMYRFSTEAKREFWRATKAEQRKSAGVTGGSGGARPGSGRKKRVASGKPLTNEQAAIKALERGDQKEYERLSEPVSTGTSGEAAIPEIPNRGQGNPSSLTGASEPGGAVTESGHWEGEDWVPD